MPSFQREEDVRASMGPVRIAGLDEAGRGPLAGPVLAAAVVFPPHFETSWLLRLDDSKKQTAAQREVLYEQITGEPSLFWATASASVEEIDEMNILQASLLAMQRALVALPVAAQYALVDGRHLPLLGVPASAVIKGDSISYSIAAASILAKVQRDRMLREIDQQYPLYGFAKHKGYGTQEHLAALQKHGATAHHRTSFRPVAQVQARSKPRSS